MKYYECIAVPHFIVHLEEFNKILLVAAAVYLKNIFDNSFRPEMKFIE